MKLRLSSLSKNSSDLDRLAKEQMEKTPEKGLEASPEEGKASRFLLGFWVWKKLSQMCFAVPIAIF